MKKIWDIKIRQSVKKEFPGDPMMQELHEIRARLSRKQKPAKIRLGFRFGQTTGKEKLKVR